MGMGLSTIWLIVMTLILFTLFYSKVFQTAEKYVNSEGFDNTVVPVQDGQQRYNPLMNLVNITNPQIPLTASTQTQVTQAVTTPILGVTSDYQNGLPGTFEIRSSTEPYKIPTDTPGILKIAQTICETITTPDCTAFANPDFAKYCGISYDPNGLDSRGKPHMGGLYISEIDRTNQLQESYRIGISPNSIRFSPSIGKAKKGLFAIDVSGCQIIQSQLQCKQSHAIGNNCTQCFTSGNFNYVDPRVPNIAPSIIIQTNATGMTIQWPDSTVPQNINVTPDVSMNITVNATEGDQYMINIQGDPANLYFCGYLSAQTAAGNFNMDLMGLIDIDLITNYKPRIGGTQVINTTICMLLRPGLGNNSMNLRTNLPFSFITPYEPYASVCDNGPIITKESSANFLANDPCYGPNSKPGAYSLTCLQQLFLGIGGITKGTGYPSDITTANVILFNEDNTPRSLSDISTFLYEINVQASTGKNTAGISLSIPEWDQASMFITGTPIVSVCDVQNKNTGPLSKDCIQYLYNNGGIGNSDGATYTLGLQNASSDANGNAIFCTSDGALSPTNPVGLQRAQAAGGVQGVKTLFDTANKTANDNTLSNAQRTSALIDCYGDKFLPQNPETYFVGGYAYTQAGAQDTCSLFGAQVANSEQLRQAQAAGADWCATGWISDSPTPQYPITNSTMAGCGNGSAGIMSWMPPGGLAGVNCYGPKPDKLASNQILPFNSTQGQWNMP